MAIALPLLASGEIAFVGVSLPKLASGEIAFVGVKLPLITSAEDIPTTLTVTPSRGVLVGGAASIAYVNGGTPGALIYDPAVPSGGVLLGGAATVSTVIVTIFDYYPHSGVLVGGTSISAFAWTQYAPVGGVKIGGTSAVSTYINAPAGGVKVGGSATVSATFVNIYDLRVLEAEWPLHQGVLVGGTSTIGEAILHVPTGGVLLGGRATIMESIRHVPAGGVLVGGTAPPLSAYLITPSGGVLVAGAALITVKFMPVVSGGVALGGGSVITDRQSWYAPSGGVAVGGTSLAYMLPAGYVVTAENPYNGNYPVWAMNYETYAPSRYTDFPANSITTYNGVTYIANRGGIYAIDGDTDVGRNISAHFTPPKYDFAQSQDKKVPVVYIGASTSAKMKMRVMVNKQAPLYYLFNDDRANGTHTRGMRATTGKALQGRYWQFRFENIDGADFEIDSVEINPVVLARRGA